MSLPMKTGALELVLAVLLIVSAFPVRAETESKWIAFGTRHHGDFGACILVGM
jgi:hypothetical protein